jgi:hypothetical protein
LVDRRLLSARSLIYHSFIISVFLSLRPPELQAAQNALRAVHQEKNANAKKRRTSEQEREREREAAPKPICSLVFVFLQAKLFFLTRIASLIIFVAKSISSIKDKIVF